MHDRRCYQLIRYCIAPESDYRTMYNGMKELKKRIEANAHAGLSETLFPLLYQTSMILYNKNHVPAILEFSKTDEKSLASIAHEVLADISQRAPEVLKAQVREICLNLQKDAPTTTRPNPTGAVDTLKACAAFANKFSDEIPQDRAFVQAMTSFALHGSPPEAAKHAISIVMAASNKKEMLAQELVKKCVKDFEYGKPGFLARLASLSRLSLLAPAEIDNHSDALIDIAIKQILLRVRIPSTAEAESYTWSTDVDEECTAKCWAVRILVNRIRSHPEPSTLTEVAEPVYTLLNTLITSEGELSKARDTPDTHKPRLRLIAARSFLKLCSSRDHDALLSPESFNRLAEVAQDSQPTVRASFVGRLKKYLSKNILPARFYTIPFILAFEPVRELKAETVTWIKSRVSFFADQKAQRASSGAEPDIKAASTRVSMVLETAFARLLSLLTHHPDYGDSAEELTEFAQYLVFYLTAVATERNVSLIHHIAQRVKACQDVVLASSTRTPAKNKESDTTDYTTRLHTLSDLAVYTIRSLIDAHSWTLQSLPGRISLPGSLFSEIKDHEKAISIAEKDFLPEDVRDGVDQLIRSSLRKASNPSSKKRKSEGGELGTAAKKPKKLPSREKDKTKKPARKARRSWDEDGSDADESKGAKRRINGQSGNAKDRRKSARASNGTRGKYRERDDSEDDAEMEEANVEQSEDEEMSEASTDEDRQEEDGGGASNKDSKNAGADEAAEDVEMADAPGSEAHEAEANGVEPEEADDAEPSSDPLITTNTRTRTRTRSTRATTTAPKPKPQPAAKPPAKTTPTKKPPSKSAAAPTTTTSTPPSSSSSSNKAPKSKSQSKPKAPTSAPPATATTTPPKVKAKAAASTPEAPTTAPTAAAAAPASSSSTRTTRSREKAGRNATTTATAAGGSGDSGSSPAGVGRVTRATRSGRA